MRCDGSQHRMRVSTIAIGLTLAVIVQCVTAIQFYVKEGEERCLRYGRDRLGGVGCSLRRKLMHCDDDVMM